MKVCLYIILKRQIASLYYERSGLSARPEKLAERVHQKTKLFIIGIQKWE